MGIIIILLFVAREQSATACWCTSSRHGAKDRRGMTLCVAVGKQYIGLVAADTRITNADGNAIDSHQTSMVDPRGGPGLPIPHLFRKIRKLWDGKWFTGNGVAQWLELTRLALEESRAQSIEEVSWTVETYWEKNLFLFDSSPQAINQIKTNSVVFLVNPEGDGYACYGINWCGDVIEPERGVVVAPPLEVPDDEWKQIERLYRLEFHEESYANGLHAMIRKTAEVFARVVAVCGDSGTVGELFEMGVTRRTRSGRTLHQHLPPTAATAVVSMSEAEIDQSLVTID